MAKKMGKVMHLFEVEFEWVGKGKSPSSLEGEYGFGINPPITIQAKSISDAKRQFKLPKSIAIRKITKVM
ncbi:MAG: hypothetical protein AM326_08295 [Candidatus Thorarchaeota archaeon SMTZ-45]|nr:MAG: hypothetical protein AM326_08295 [Candidatus Thorarchaeota archaeon SMTZ-45]